MAVIKGTSADIYVTSGAAIPFSDEAMTDTGDRTTYKITAATKRFWDRATAVVVEKNTGGGFALVSASDYDVVHAGGRIRFHAQQPEGTTVRVDGGYLAVSKFAQGKEWSLDYERLLREDTVFGVTAHTNRPTIGQGSLTVSRWLQDDYFLGNDAELLGFSLYLDQPSGSRFDAFARLNSNSPHASVGEIVEESATFTVEGEISFATS